jgi:hypothetical protein
MYKAATSAPQSMYKAATSASQSMYKAAKHNLYGSTSDEELLNLFKYICNSLILSIKAKKDLSEPYGYDNNNEDFDKYFLKTEYIKPGETFIDSYIHVVVPHIAVRDYDKAYKMFDVWSRLVYKFATRNNDWYPLIADIYGETGHFYIMIVDIFKSRSIDILNELKKGSRLSIITDTNEKNEAIATMQEEYKRVGAQKLIELHKEHKQLESRKEEIKPKKYYDAAMISKLMEMESYEENKRLNSHIE